MSEPIFKDVIEEFDGALLAGEAKHSHATTSHYPSTASCKVDGKVYGKCLRSLYYQWTNAPKIPKVAGDLWSMSMGNWIHAGLQDLYKANYPCLAEKAGKQTIEGLEHPISYRIDLFREDGQRGKYNVEIKSSYGMAFDLGKLGIETIEKDGYFKDDRTWLVDNGYLTKYGGITDKVGELATKKEKNELEKYIFSKAYGLKVKPKDDHILQSICYQKLELSDFTELFYLARDNCYRTSYIIEEVNGIFYVNDVPTPLTFEGIVDRWKEVEIHLKAKTLPPRDFNWCGKCGKNGTEGGKICPECDWNCVYCDFRGICYGQSKMQEILKNVK